MSDYSDIYIAHEDGSFKNHLWSNLDCSDGPITLCKFATINLSSTPEDLLWYYEHERDDVTNCDSCFTAFLTLHYHPNFWGPRK